jgi:hypothetical protein
MPIMAQIAPWLGGLLVLAGIVALWRARDSALRLPQGQRAEAFRPAFAMLLLGVTVLTAWWTILLEPRDFPWLAVSAALGLTALALLMTIFAFLEARQPHPWSVPEKA